MRTFTVLTALLAASVACYAQETAPARPLSEPEVGMPADIQPMTPIAGVYNVVDFGAVGDGETDDTDAFQRALDRAGEKGGVVKVPVGQFMIKTHLNVPPNVTLEGVWTAPVRGLPIEGGSVLLAVEGKGSTEGPPFIMLNSSSVLKGLSIFYPEQVQENPPHEYPWTVGGEGDNCTIINVTMINPYKAVDFGTRFCGRHYINGLYAQALYKGLFIDQCYDVGRIENIHFWPFWVPLTEGPLYDFTMEHGTAFTIARTDGEMGVNLFQIFYHTGFLFTDAGHGGGSGMYTNVYSDISPVALRVEATHGHAPVTFVNGSFMTAVEVDVEKQALVNFSACGFWTMRDTRFHVETKGPAQVTITGSTFYDWDRVREDYAAIENHGEALTLTGNNFFMRRPGVKVRLHEGTEAAVIVGNRMKAGATIENNAGDEADVQIGLNTSR